MAHRILNYCWSRGRIRSRIKYPCNNFQSCRKAVPKFSKEEVSRVNERRDDAGKCGEEAGEHGGDAEKDEAVKEKELETGKGEKSRKLEESSQVMMISYRQPMRILGIILSPRLWRRFQMKQSQLFQGQL